MGAGASSSGVQQRCSGGAQDMARSGASPANHRMERTGRCTQRQAREGRVLWEGRRAQRDGQWRAGQRRLVVLHSLTTN